MGTIVAKTRKNGGKSYEAKVKRGKEVSSQTFRSLADAQNWIIDESKRFKDTNTPTKRRVWKTTIPDVIDFYLENIDINSVSTNQKYTLGSLRRQFAGVVVEEITVESLKKYINGMLKTEISEPANKKKTSPLYDGDKKRFYSASTVRKYCYALKGCLEFHASKHGYQLPNNLFSHNKQYTIPSAWDGQRNRRLYEGESEKILDSIGRGYQQREVLKSIFLFALETAMRAQEITLAEWKDLNLKGRTLNIPASNTKTGVSRQIPLSRDAIKILKTEKKRREGKGDGRIFDEMPNSIKLVRAWRRVAVRASLRDLKLHDLRHEAISRLFEKGNLHVLEIAEITGHAEIETLRRYISLTPSRLVDKMD